MTNPFLNVNVQPSYGRNKAIISWLVRPGYGNADFYVYKSFNRGTPPWTLINEEPVRGTFFQDPDMSNVVSYRVLMIHNNREYDSPIIFPYDKMSKMQYGGVHKMMKLEFMRMTTGNGIQVLHYTPLIRGEYADDTDHLTEQKYGVHCKDGELTDVDYGQKFKGGFAPPVYTWIEIREYGKFVNQEDESKLAMRQDITHTGRMLAFPVPQPGDLIVHPTTDNRYGVTSPLAGDYFRGVFPISFNVGLQLLNRADPRYGVPVPSVLPKPIWAKYD